MENFNKIYSDNHKAVLSFISFKISDTSIAEELSNDVFMRVHKHLHRYDAEKSAIKTWVMNIAKNIVIDHYRKVKMDAISLDSSISSNEDSKITVMDRMHTNSNPLKEIVSEEMVDLVKDEISSLDDKYKDVAELFFISELSYEEISDRLYLPIGTVKGQLSRARKQLVERLEAVRI